MARNNLEHAHFFYEVVLLAIYKSIMKYRYIQTNNTMYGVIMLPKRALIEHTQFKHAFVIVLNSVVTTISDNLWML